MTTAKKQCIVNFSNFEDLNWKFIEQNSSHQTYVLYLTLSNSMVWKMKQLPFFGIAFSIFIEGRKEHYCWNRCDELFFAHDRTSLRSKRSAKRKTSFIHFKFNYFLNLFFKF